MTSINAGLGSSGGDGQDSGLGNRESRSNSAYVASPQQGTQSILRSVHAAAAAPLLAAEVLSSGGGDGSESDPCGASIHRNAPPHEGRCCGKEVADGAVASDTEISCIDPTMETEDVDRTPSLSELPAAYPSPRHEGPVCNAPLHVMKPSNLNCALPTELPRAFSAEDVSPCFLLQKPCWTDSNHTDESLVCPPTHLGQSPDQSLSHGTEDADPWRGWTMQTSEDGRLFYHHTESGTSQWCMPRGLSSVLGEWLEVHDEAGNKYWRNELMGISAWKDPSHATNLFQAALDGNLFFLQLYTEAGGFLDAVDPKGRTALHYNCASGSTAAVLHLLQRSASAHLQDSTGSSPLHWACRYSHAPIVRMLLEAGKCSDDVDDDDD
eukprot:CAMPEP_0172844812 /NCGR_PEP_ID=MMETSP1075-20121228/32496_1 /TAXON_ID=2916 /ORGANISM="Ceratium fusus, Strain PA161109" /LENGTH=379 /DNA_ID=CAMNT_0013689335 /DNA_START=18 /DNA_END=1155 /DNA_ORIENTATION=-